MTAPLASSGRPDGELSPSRSAEGRASGTRDARDGQVAEPREPEPVPVPAIIAAASWAERLSVRFRGAASVVSAAFAGLFGHETIGMSALAPRMSFRWRRQDVEPDELRHYVARRSTALGTAAAAPTIDVAVLVHGLMRDEANWLDFGAPFVDSMRRRMRREPLLVRYNSGLHISTNGDLLANRLIALHRAWGSSLGRIMLVGHSMGGLVARSALRRLEDLDADVLEHVDSLVLLATPNHGATLERIAAAVEQAARATPGSAARYALRGAPERAGAGVGVSPTTAATADNIVHWLGQIFALRSDGIRDLRYGYLLADEWRAALASGEPPGESFARPCPPPDGVITYAVAGSLVPGVGPSRSRTDGMVTVASAAGIGPRYDDIGAIRSGRFHDVFPLIHAAVPSSPRVFAWVEHMARADGLIAR